MAMKALVMAVAAAGFMVAAGQQAGPAAIRWQTYSLQTDRAQIPAELGRLLVPERRGSSSALRPGSGQTRTVDLAFVRVKSKAASPGAPVIYLDGGPGGSGIGAARVEPLSRLFEQILNSADLILLSQRGTGLSTPRVGCLNSRPLPDDFFVSVDNMIRETSDRERECAASLRSQGFDLAGYTTEESADDVEAIRAALGVPKVSLLGFSYGTHLGLSVLRRHEARIDRAVLVGVEGPDHTWKLPATYDLQVAAIAGLVAKDPKASAVMPDFSGALRRLLTATAAKPIVVSIDVRGAKRPMQIGAPGILYLLRRDIGDTNDTPWIPAFVFETLSGKLERLAEVATRRVSQLESGVNVMPTAMDCASAASALRLQEIARQQPSSIFGALTNFPFPDVCAATGIQPLGEQFRQPIKSSVPTVFVSGTLDSNTPPDQAEEVRQGFRTSAHLIVEHAGHESTLPEPVRQRAARFLAGAVIKDERLSISPPAFRLPK